MEPSEPKASLEASTAASFRGERIGKFEVIAQLSVGGMAELFLAFTSGPGGFRKYAAVKRILPDVRSDEQFIRMFLDEARLTAGFNHPSIAHVFELGEEADGLFLAMEFVAGQNLNQVSAACRQARRRVPFGFTASVMCDVCAALDYAYHFRDPSGRALEIIHRDVAQKNVMVGYDGTVKLLDFGIAKSHGSLGRTQVGHVKGTTGYMSPEQVVGGALDARSDVFSVGVVMYELLTGQRLFAGATEEDEMRNILAQRIPRPAKVDPEIPEPLSDLVMRALAREKADRFPDARSLAQAIRLACGDLCFDVERRAALMRERFDAQVRATRTLMDSAVRKTSPKEIAAALDVLHETWDGAGTEVSTARKPPVSEDAPAPLPPGVARAETVLLEPKDPISRSPPPESHGSHALGGIALVLFLLAGAVAFVGLWLFGGSTTKPLGGDPTGGMRPIPFAKSAGSPPAPVQARKALAPANAPSTQPASAEPARKPEPRRHHARVGRLTLVTHPRAEVFEGNRRLGTTPLFGVKLSVGMHRLRLEGADGRMRMLSVPIRDGKPLALRISLSDLPVR